MKMTFRTLRYVFEVGIIRPLFVVVGLTLALGGAAILLLTPPRPPQAINLQLDGTLSTGLDYSNHYIPLACRIITRGGGVPFRVCRFGGAEGAEEVVFDGVLTSEEAVRIRGILLASHHFSRKEAEGTAISVQAVRQMAWFRGQTGSRFLLVIFSDDIEQGGPALAHVASGSAKGVTALVLFPRMPVPKVAEALRLAGAEVVVARTPAEADAAVQRALTGMTPVRQAARTTGLRFIPLGFLLLLPGLVGVRRRKLDPVPVPVPVPVPPVPPVPVLGPLQVRLEAVVEQHPMLRAEKRLHCRNGALVIARRPAPEADLELPVEILGRITEIAVSLQPLTLDRVRVKNLGTDQIVAGTKALKQGEAAEISVTERLMLGPKVRVQIGVEAV